MLYILLGSLLVLHPLTAAIMPFVPPQASSSSTSHYRADKYVEVKVNGLAFPSGSHVLFCVVLTAFAVCLVFLCLFL